MEEPLHVSSPLGTRVNVDQICQDCELEILGILFTMDFGSRTSRSLMSSLRRTGSRNTESSLIVTI